MWWQGSSLDEWGNKNINEEKKLGCIRDNGNPATLKAIWTDIANAVNSFKLQYNDHLATKINYPRTKIHR